jgi:hypothetical protein
MPPTILIMMLLKMGPWAEEDKDKKDETPSYHYPLLPTRPDRWYETWWAALGFVFVILGIVIGLAFLLGYLMLKYP